MSVIWRTRALADVARIVRHIAADNPVAAARVARELLRRATAWCYFPDAAGPGDKTAPAN